MEIQSSLELISKYNKTKININKVYNEIYNAVTFVHLKKCKPKFSELNNFTTDVKQQFNDFNSRLHSNTSSIITDIRKYMKTIDNSHQAYLNEQISHNDHENNCKKLYDDINVRSDKFKDIHGTEYELLTNELEKYDKEVSALSSILNQKYQSEYKLELQPDSIKNNISSQDEIKLKIKNEGLNPDEDLEAQIKDKISHIDDEVVMLKGKGGYFGWTKDDHNVFLKSYNGATTKQRQNVEELTSVIYDQLATTKTNKEIQNHLAKYKLYMKLLDVKKEWVGKYQEYKKKKQAAFIEQNDAINQTLKIEIEDPEKKLKLMEEKENKKKILDDWKERKQLEEQKKREHEIKKKESNRGSSSFLKFNSKQKEKLEQYKQQKEEQKAKANEKDKELEFKENNFDKEAYNKIKKRNLEKIESAQVKLRERQLKDQEKNLKIEIKELKLRDKYSNVESKLNEKTTSVKAREVIMENEKKLKEGQEKGKFGNHYSGIDVGNMLGKSAIGGIMK